MPIPATQVKVGMTILYNGQPHRVTQEPRFFRVQRQQLLQQTLELDSPEAGPQRCPRPAFASPCQSSVSRGYSAITRFFRRRSPQSRRYG